MKTKQSKNKIAPKLFEIELSDTIIAADPCYTRGTWCAAWDIKVKPGKYVAEATYSDEGRWGIRVKSLSIFHESIKISHSGFKKYENVEIGVDSGQAGFFCNSIYPQGELRDSSDKESFYRSTCKATDNQIGVVSGRGVVSSSGFGDGGYPLYKKINKSGEIVALKIKFL